ncbi:MAG: hypothetical protein JJE23_07110 [Thermoleophilia bacterium]|nr:hypothetical protein [Thermoleophilia bacterium]
MYVSIGGPIFIIAVGAILRYATNFDVSGVDMDTVGLILMIAGIAALLLSLGVALFNKPNRGSGGGDAGGQPPAGGPPTQY